MKILSLMFLVAFTALNSAYAEENLAICSVDHSGKKTAVTIKKWTPPFDGIHFSDLLEVGEIGYVFGEVLFGGGKSGLVTITRTRPQSGGRFHEVRVQGKLPLSFFDNKNNVSISCRPSN